MFLKIGSQLTVMDNSVCNKGVYEETSFFIYFKKNKKESIATLSYNALGIRKGIVLVLP